MSTGPCGRPQPTRLTATQLPGVGRHTRAPVPARTQDTEETPYPLAPRPGQGAGEAASWLNSTGQEPTQAQVPEVPWLWHWRGHLEA